MVCPCCVPQQPCCGIPTNCVAALVIDGVPYAYNPANSKWQDENGMDSPFSASFGNCQDDAIGTGDAVYTSCCLSASAADTPLIGEPDICVEWFKHVYARIVCDECCTEPPPSVGINCRLENAGEYVDFTGSCEPYIPDFYFTLTCSEEDCNEFP